jgi:murein DD-endopeptidase MepM/ murein hydrolase activator NlpD
MSLKDWTILIVPPGNERTRTIRIGPRGRRALVAATGTAALLVTSAIVILFTPYATPGARLVARENDRLRADLGLIDERLSALGDTLAALGTRDQQLRLLAGLPIDSSVEIADAGTASPARGSRPSLAGVVSVPRLPRPFLGRLGFTGRPDIDGMIQRATDLAASFRAVSDTLTRNYERLASTPSIQPTAGWLSSHFSQSRFHPILHENRPHEGIDVSAPMGAPIIAPAAGRVKSVTNEPGYGNSFEIDHGNGIVTRYAHCSKILVHIGQVVTRRQLIATVGNTGLSTGPHLHYEVHVNGRPVDPLKFVLPVPEKVAD